MATKKKKTAKKKATLPRAGLQTVGGGVPASAPVAVPPPPLPPTPSMMEGIEENRAKIRAIASQFNKPGHMAVVTADEAPNPYTLRRPTGIMNLDIDLAGGWPAGGICMISGEDNTGKTWLLLRTMAMQQRIYGEACSLAFAVTEGPFPYDQALRAGLRISVPDRTIREWNQLNRERGLPEYTAEQIAAFKYQIGDFHVIRGDTGEEYLTIIHKLAEANVCSIIGVDSVQGLQPMANADKDLGDNDKRAAHAVMMIQFFNKYIPTTTGLNGVVETSLIMTQQVRANDAKSQAQAHIQKYLPDTVVKGGMAQKHYKLIDVELKDGSKHHKEVAGHGRVAIGKDINWTFLKGKAGAHDNTTGSVKFLYGVGDGVDNNQTVLDVGIELGVIQKQGSRVVVVTKEGTVRNDLSASSLIGLKRDMDLDFAFEMAIRREILAAKDIKCIYRSE